MKTLLILLLLIGLLTSGCIGDTAKPEMKFVDLEYPSNYIVFNTTEKTFAINTTEYIASGTYSETSEFYILKYAEYPVGTTIRKNIDNDEPGIEIAPGHVWYRA